MKKIGFFFRSKWEVFKYNRRKAARTKKNIPTIWRSHLKLVSEELKLLHEVDADKFDENLLAKTIDAYKKTNSKLNKVWFVSFLLIVYLVFTTFDIELPISVFGIKLFPTPGLNEILIVLISVLNAFNAGGIISSLTILTSAKTIMSLIHKDGFKYFRNLNSNIDDAPSYCIPTMMPHITWTKPVFIVSAYALTFLIIKLLFVAAAFFLWRYFVYMELIDHPTISSDISQIAVVFAIILDFISISYLLVFSIPLPHKNFQINHTLEIVRQLQPEKYNEMCREVYGEDWDDEAYMIRNGYLKQK